MQGRKGGMGRTEGREGTNEGEVRREKREEKESTWPPNPSVNNDAVTQSHTATYPKS